MGKDPFFSFMPLAKCHFYTPGKRPFLDGQRPSFCKPLHGPAATEYLDSWQVRFAHEPQNVGKEGIGNSNMDPLSFSGLAHSVPSTTVLGIHDL